MLVVVQRVTSSRVWVNGSITGEIAHGLNLLLGIMKGDTQEDATKLSQKILEMRIFEDEKGKMSRSLSDIGGALLIISQFTLGANLSKGRRPGFDQAELPEKAKVLYEHFVAICRQKAPVETGIFGAMMKVEIINDGPVTFILDSRA